MDEKKTLSEAKRKPLTKKEIIMAIRDPIKRQDEIARNIHLFQKGK